MLYASFLTRSGILGETSVHSFTDLGMFGHLILYIVAFLIISVYFVAVSYTHLDVYKRQVTGHAEAVQVIYNPNVISFSQLVAAFFVMHDPTQLNRQGPDVGESYRSVAFYNNAEEKKQIEEAITQYDKSGFHLEPVVTEVKAYDVFYPAETYHQNYYKLNPNSAYIVNVCGPKVQKLSLIHI